MEKLERSPLNLQQQINDLFIQEVANLFMAKQSQPSAIAEWLETNTHISLARIYEGLRENTNVKRYAELVLELKQGNYLRIYKGFSFLANRKKFEVMLQKNEILQAEEHGVDVDENPLLKSAVYYSLLEILSGEMVLAHNKNSLGQEELNELKANIAKAKETYELDDIQNLPETLVIMLNELKDELPPLS